MATTISEDRQHLHFEDGWFAFQWDEADEFVRGILSACPGIKGADVVAVRPATAQSTGMIVIAEFKDYDNPKIPVKYRAQHAAGAVTDTLRDEIVRKVVDTLAGAAHSHSRGVRNSVLDLWSDNCHPSRADVLILVCSEIPKTQALQAPIWTKALQQRLSWLGPRSAVYVTDGRNPFDGFGIRYSVS